MRKITEEMIQNAIEEGINPRDAKRGYVIVSDPDIGLGAEHIQCIQEMNAFDDDTQASYRAQFTDGISIIRDWSFDEKDSANYLDTYENRKILLDVFKTMQVSLSNAEVKALMKYLPSMITIAKTFDDESGAQEAIAGLESLMKKFNWFNLTKNDVEIQVDSEKLRKYIDEGMILEFETSIACMEYLNLYDYQKFQNTEDMKAYQGEYGFEYNGKWYHVCTEDALDVYRRLLKNN